jgi:hypothetical protein
VASPEEPVAPPGEPVTLVVRIEPGEPIAGTVRAEGEPSGHPFSGWVELMAHIIAARHREPGGSASR